MAREGLFDDTGYHGFDYEPPCSKCKYEGLEEFGGRMQFKCLASHEVCDFEEKEDSDED